MKYNNLKLEPVFRFSPWDFSEEFGSKDYLAELPIIEHQKFINNCFLKMGLKIKNFIDKETWFISTDEFNQNELENLYKFNLKGNFKHEDQNGQEKVFHIEKDKMLTYLWFSGGYLLKDSEKPLIYPGCCVGFEHIIDWEGMVKNNNDGWEILWIGHPYVYYKYLGEEILILNQDDYEKNNFENYYSFDYSEINKAVLNCKNNIILFSNKILSIYKELSQKLDFKIEYI